LDLANLAEDRQRVRVLQQRKRNASRGRDALIVLFWCTVAIIREMAALVEENSVCSSFTGLL
jgi:hypothetical protein